MNGNDDSKKLEALLNSVSAMRSELEVLSDNLAVLAECAKEAFPEAYERYMKGKETKCDRE